MKTSYKAMIYCLFNHYELEVPVGCFNSEETAAGVVDRTKVIVDLSRVHPGITLSRDGEEIFVSADALQLQVLSEGAQSRLGKPLDISVAREKEKAVEALHVMDPAYVVTEADFITVSRNEVCEFLTHCGDGRRLHVSSYQVSAESMLSDAEMGDYQKRAGEWAATCFGQAAATDLFQRRNRFIEEAIELHQASGGSLDEIIQLVHHVYNKPIGDPHQEVGGTMVTLATLCNALGVDLLPAGEDELARVWEEFPRIRAKQAAAKEGSPLPGKVDN